MKPRWSDSIRLMDGTRASGSMPMKHRFTFLGYAGSLDVYLHIDLEPSEPGAFRVYCDPRSRTLHNHTDIEMDEEGGLHPIDTDVVPTPYEMCLIYQIYEEYNRGET